MAELSIGGERLTIQEVFSHNLTVPDCIVDNDNKIGGGNGEKKFYIASKDTMRGFFGERGFTAKCFVLKSDLIEYLNKVHSEYLRPSQPYRAASNLAELWVQRMAEIQSLEEVIEFDMYDQTQIDGARGYVNTEVRENKKIIARGINKGYRLITKIALPLISYVRIMRLTTSNGAEIFYWKLFPDFDAIEDKQDALVHKYGKKYTDSPIDEPIGGADDDKQYQIRQARKGQGKYRENLLKECWYCPFTHIIEPELLIASHIKPWRDATDSEKIDPKNGFALTPMYDKLFDRGFITFTDDRKVRLSNWISPRTYKIIGLEENQFIQDLPLDDKRKVYLDYHRNFVFNN